jgi:tetratricopeptide (TPR) repeat protein
MGGAFTAIADDATALFWNPAGLARIGHQEIAGSHADLFRTGIKDNHAAFVLPLSPDQAAALDWYHSGFDDGELGFGENRLGLGYALKMRSWLSVGVDVKLLTRNTDLDGMRVQDGRGFGADLGFLAVPTERLRFGFVAQDLFGTKIEGSDGVSHLVYPRNLRVGTSYTYGRWGTAALDVDDRWHVGFELTPLTVVALRFGAEDDRRGSERATWTYGLGVKAGLLRVDYARVDHPTLDATDHYSVAMEFNFNPAQIRIEKVEARDLYTSLYKSYARDPFGTVQVRNLQDRPLSARFSVFVPELMDGPSDQEVILRPKATQQVPLTAVFGERVLAQRGDKPVEVQVAASYQSKRLVRREKRSARCVAYSPGAIDWGQGVAQAAAFITPRDPAVDALAREAGRIVALREHDPLRNRNLSFAAAMTDALAELGVAYVPDPNNPYASIAEMEHAVDTIHYPHETLRSRSGDCDDTTVLLASLLENVGVPTRLVDAPGHIFLLVGTGLHERNRLALGLDETMYVIADEEVWVPVETTALGKGFAEAWSRGVEAYRSWGARGQLTLVDVAEAQGRYEPVLPPGGREISTADVTRLTARLDEDAQAVSRWRATYFASRYAGLEKDLGASVDALNEIARVYLLAGKLAEARARLEQALEKDPGSVTVHNNLAVVLAGQDSLAQAEAHWQTALALGSDAPGVWLNLGLARYVQGDTLPAAELLAEGLERAGGYASACQLLGLPPGDEPERAGTTGLTAAELRLLLRTALRKVPSPAVGRAEPQGAPGRSATAARLPKLRVAAVRSEAAGELLRYLHWMERE